MRKSSPAAPGTRALGPETCRCTRTSCPCLPALEHTDTDALSRLRKSHKRTELILLICTVGISRSARSFYIHGEGWRAVPYPAAKSGEGLVTLSGPAEVLR